MDENEFKARRALQKQQDRAEIANQLVRSGFLMNGGGAITLLAFVQASVESKHFAKFAPWSATSILVFVLGVAIAGLANYFRVKVSLADDQPASIEKARTICISRALQLIPIACFFLGCVVFAIAIFRQFGLPAL